MNLNPIQKNVGELLSGRLFRIPDYQRAYSWETAQRNDLFADIREAQAKKRKHFMATVVARQSETMTITGDDFSVVDIIDGQQRVTTLVILLKAIAKALESKSGEEGEIAAKINRLLVKGDNYQAVLLQTNHGASGIFANYIKAGVIAKKNQVKTSADQNLVNAMRECEAFIQSDAANLGPTEIYTTVSSRFILIYHQIEDESVVRVFETLNSRGLVVEWLDKTKSQLMALLFEHAGNAMENALKEMRSIWAGVYDTLGLDVRNGAEAMRFAGTLKRQDRPNRILGEEDASRSIVSFAQTEVDTIVGAGRWLAKVVENHNKIVSNSRLFGVTRVRHARFLATAILLRGWPDKTEQALMDKWEKVTFRIFGLADESARAKVGDYVRLGYDIINDEKVDPKAVLARLGEIGTGFEIESILSEKGFWDDCYDSWTTELRYILFRYEEHLAKLDGENLDKTAWNKIWETDASKSIEHIWPQSKGNSWVHELGNLTMLTPGMNSRWRTHNFVDFTFIFDTLQKNSKQEKSMARSDMRDFEWDFIEKLLPNKSRGVKRVDDRRVINGILYALRTGIPWRDMPEQYGPWSTIYNRFNRWSKAGIWDMIFEAIVDSHNVNTVMVDSTSVRAHPTAAKLKKTDKRRCLGRSRGGLGTKIHASNNQDGLPLKLELTPNQANDAPPCGTLLTGLQPGQWVLADKAYDVNWIRNMIWEQGAIDVIPSKSNRKIPKEFDKVMYRQRNKIERFFGRLKASFRRIATRYEHTSANFLAMIKLACVRLWLEFYEYAA